MSFDALSSGKGGNIDPMVVSDTRIMLVSGDIEISSRLKTFLKEIGYPVLVADSCQTAKIILNGGNAGILITDLDLPDGDAVEMACNAKEVNRFLECIAIVPPDKQDLLVDSLDSGFTGAIFLPLDDPAKYSGMLYKCAERFMNGKKMEEERRSLLASSTRLTGKNLQMEAKIGEIESAMAVAATLASPHYTFSERLNICLEIILERIGSSRGSIHIVDEEKGELTILAASKTELLGKKVSLDSNSVAAWVARNAKPLNVADIENFDMSGDFKESMLDKYKGAAFLSSPIKGYKKVLGVFNVTEKLKGSFTKDDELLLFRLLDRIAVTMENAHLTERIKEDQRKLMEAHEKLKELEELKNNLMHMIVHDMKSPIGEIMANLSMLANANLDDFEKDTLLISQVGAENLLNMVMNILDVSRMDEGKMHLNISDVDLQKVANDKAEQLEAVLKLDDKHLAVKAEGENSTVEGDEMIITRVLVNLLTNALNYSPQGETVTITLEDMPPDKLRVGVHDRGPGVPEDYREKIFQKFESVGEDKGKSKYSTGLGLTFCKMAVEAHGGEIWVEAGKEVGSVFYFTLRRRRVDTENGA